MSWQPQGPADPYRAPEDGLQAPEGAQPTYQQPTYQQPTYQQPTYQQPTYQQPTAGGYPGYGQSTYPYPAHPQAAYPQWGVPPTVRHRPWSTALAWVYVGNGVLSALGVLALLLDGTSAIEPSRATSTDLAVYTGVIVVVVAVMLLATGGLITWAFLARRAADGGRPGSLKGLAVVTIVLGVLGVLGAMSSMAQGVPPFGVVVGGLYLALGIKVSGMLRV